MDVLVRPVSGLNWDTTTWVEELDQQIGGNGANTSYTIARLGVPARLLSAVGQDSFGDRAIEILKSAGTDVGFVRRSAAPTPATVVLVNSDGRRALLHRPGASRDAFTQPIEIAAELMAGCTHFHLANLYALPSLQPHAADLIRRMRAAGLITSIDTGWDARGRWMDTLAGCLGHADLLFVNRDEARHLTGAGDPGHAAMLLQDHGVRDVVVKLGAEGCLVCSGGFQFHSPAFPVSVLDTTGAGDCFVGGFLAALQRGFSIFDAAQFANAVGALSVQAMGGITGLLPWDQTIAWLETALR